MAFLIISMAALKQPKLVPVINMIWYPESVSLRVHTKIAVVVLQPNIVLVKPA